MGCVYCDNLDPIKPQRMLGNAVITVEECALHLELDVELLDQVCTHHAWFPVNYCPMCGESFYEEEIKE